MYNLYSRFQYTSILCDTMEVELFVDIRGPHPKLPRASKVIQRLLFVHGEGADFYLGTRICN